MATELPDSITESDVQAGVKAFYEIAIPADSFARAVVFALSQPDDVDINEILFRRDEAGILSVNSACQSSGSPDASRARNSPPNRKVESARPRAVRAAST